MPERLQKILSRLGIASRREAEKLILSGHVLVNGQRPKLGDKADETQDKIVVNNCLINSGSKNKESKNNFIYYLLNKPVGYICSRRRKKGERLAIDLVPENPRVWTVGRLDKDSSGLLILTNDGRLTEELTHPKFEHEKEYLVEVDRKIKSDFFVKMKSGVKLTEGLACADKIKPLGTNKFLLTIHQGWKRQIRRMCYALGYSVKSLTRVRIGQWRLENLAAGKCRIISKIQ